MFKSSKSQNAQVKFHCPGMEDKLSLEMYSGDTPEKFIFFRKIFESHAASCEWTEAQGVTQLKRALCGQALQEFLDKESTYTTMKGCLDSLQDHYVGADAHRRYHKAFRNAKQDVEHNQSVGGFLKYFQRMVILQMH